MKAHHLHQNGYGKCDLTNLSSPVVNEVLSLLKTGPSTRDDMVKRSGIPRTTLYEAIRRLILANIVKKYPAFKTEQVRGRPQVLFELVGGD